MLHPPSIGTSLRLPERECRPPKSGRPVGWKVEGLLAIIAAQYGASE